MATTQELFKAAMVKADAIKTSAEAKGAWVDDDKIAFDAALKNASGLKDQLVKETAFSALKDWGEQPDGQGAVKASLGAFAGQAMDLEDRMDGVQEEYTSDHKSTGHLYDTNGIGMKKLKVMRSGAYKDAWVDWFRSECQPKRAMKADSMKVLNEGSDQAGVFWIPPDIRPELVKKTATVTGINNNCYKFPTGSDLVKFPKVLYTTDDIWTTGMRPVWSSEPLSADLTESTNPVAAQAEIPIYTGIVPIFVTRAQVEDNGFDLLGYLADLIGETKGLFEDQAYLLGDGNGKPQGILSHPNVTVATASGGMRVASGAAATYIWGVDAVLGMTGIEAALPPQYEANAKWYGHKKSYALVRAIVDGQSRPLWNINDQYPSFTNGFAPTLLGYPTVKDNLFTVPAAGTNSLLLGDAMGYYAPQRIGLSIEVLREVKALRDQYVVYARFRVGGQLVQDWRMKVLNTAAT